MTTIAQVREALASVIKANTDLTTHPYVVNPITPPMAWVNRQTMDPDTVFTRGTNTYQFRVTVFANRVDERSAQIALDEFCAMAGDKSIRVAVDTEDNWPDGLVHYAKVTAIGGAYVFRMAEVDYLASDIDVEVVF